MVSPNELESEELVGHEFSDEEDRRIAVGEIAELGAREALMTMPDGCLDGFREAPRRCEGHTARGGRLRRKAAIQGEHEKLVVRRIAGAAVHREAEPPPQRDMVTVSLEK